LPDNYLSNPSNTNDINKIKDGVKIFSRFLEVENQELNGRVMYRDLESVKLSMNQFYKTYYPYGTF